MIGRTNALVRALVSSVNGMTGIVTLNSNIAYDPSETYDEGTIGSELQNLATSAITEEQIDALYVYIEPTPELTMSVEPNRGMRSIPLGEIEEPEEEIPEETKEEPVEETVETPVEVPTEENTEETTEEPAETNEQEDEAK